MAKTVQILKAVVGWALTVALAVWFGMNVGSWAGARFAAAVHLGDAKALTIAGMVVVLVSELVLFLGSSVLLAKMLRAVFARIPRAVVGWKLTVAFSATLLVIFLSFIDTEPHFVAFVGNPNPFALLGAIFSFLLLLGSAILLARACRKRGWDAGGQGRALLLAVGVLVMALLVWDAAPIPNDYSVNDLVPKGNDVVASRETLLTYGSRSAQVIRTRMAITQLNKATTGTLPFAKEIEQAWDDIAEARQVIDKLAAYDVVADVVPGMRLDTNVQIIKCKAYMTIGRVYWAYARLRLEQGRPEDAARELVRLHTAVRKGLSSSTLVVTKLTWVWLARQDILTVHAIATHPDVSRETLDLLRQGFAPFSLEDISLRKPMIGEYVALKTTLQDPAGKHRPSFIQRTLFAIGYHLTIQPNRTVRDIREVTDRLLRGTAKPVPDFREAQEWYRQHQRLPLRNSRGWLLMVRVFPNYQHAAGTALAAKILSDLLFLELSGRLGEKLECADPYTDASYARDDRGQPFSAGPDRQPGTGDDITLGQLWNVVPVALKQTGQVDVIGK